MGLNRHVVCHVEPHGLHPDGDAGDAADVGARDGSGAADVVAAVDPAVDREPGVVAAAPGLVEVLGPGLRLGQGREGVEVDGADPLGVVAAILAAGVDVHADHAMGAGVDDAVDGTSGRGADEERGGCGEASDEHCGQPLAEQVLHVGSPM